MMKTYTVQTSSREQFLDVTNKLLDAVNESGVQEGVVTAFVPHTTAALTINENADPAVKRDLLVTLRSLIPEKGDYHHAEGNSDAHLKVSLLGSSERVLILQGQLVLGTWQGVYFTEFDGPRQRKLHVLVEGK